MSGIKHLEGRTRPLRLGKVVRGYQTEKKDKKTGKVEMRNGKPVTYPVPTDYFILKEEVQGAADEVYELLETREPKMLPIRFLGSRRAEVFPQACELFRGDKLLKCRGTGGKADDPGMVLFRRELYKEGGETKDEVVIKKAVLPYLPEPDGEAAAKRFHDQWVQEYGTAEVVETQRTVVCLGVDCPKFSLTGCRDTGRLLFTIQGAERTGHWEMTVHTLAIQAFNYQLDQLISMVEPYVSGGLSLVPFILTMGPEQQLKLSDTGLKVKYYDPHLEVDPRFLRAVLEGRIGLPAREEYTGEDIWGAKTLPTPEDVPGLPEPEETTVDYEPDEEPEEPSEEAQDALRQAMWAYAKKKGIKEPAVNDALEDAGGDPVKALATLKAWMNEA